MKSPHIFIIAVLLFLIAILAFVPSETLDEKVIEVVWNPPVEISKAPIGLPANGGGMAWTEKIRRENTDGTYYYVYKDHTWADVEIVVVGSGGSEGGDDGWSGGHCDDTDGVCVFKIDQP